jgi:hypothetical protein
VNDNQRRMLSAAVKLIETGWTRGAFMRKHHGKMHYCARGALDVARNKLGYSVYSEDWRELRHAIDRAVREKTSGMCMGLVDFNDAQKSKRPVIALLKEVATS